MIAALFVALFGVLPAAYAHSSEHGVHAGLPALGISDPLSDEGLVPTGGFRINTGPAIEVADGESIDDGDQPPERSDKSKSKKPRFVTAPPGGTAPVIVMTREGASTRHLALGQQGGGKLGKVLPAAKAFSGELTQEAIDALEADPDVLTVVPDRPVKAGDSCKLEPASGSGIVTATLKLSREAMGTKDSSDIGDKTGVAVIDSGIQTGNVNASIVFKDFVNGKTSPYDDNGHGTHIAGILASKIEGDNQGFFKKMTLVAVKALGVDGTSTASAITDALYWVAKNQSLYNIRVVNLSLGASATLPYQYDPLAQAVEYVWNSGIVVVVSAGNSGPDAATITSPGIDPYAITVGAADTFGTTDISNDAIAPFSSRGSSSSTFRKPDLVAPGTRIISLLATDSYLHKNFPSLLISSSLIRLSGTSMAAPMVAALAAQIAYKYPALSPNQVKTAIVYSARNMGQDVYAQGYGYANVESALKYISKYGDSPQYKISKVNPGVAGTSLATYSSTSGKAVYDWLMQDGVLVDDQLIRWLRDTRGVDETLIRWLIDHSLINQSLVYYIGDNGNLGPDNIEPQLVRWALDKLYLNSSNVDSAFIYWAVTNPAVQYIFADWLEDRSPIVNDQLITWLRARGIDETLIRWLLETGYVEAHLIRWLAENTELDTYQVDGALIRWLTLDRGWLDENTVTDYLIRWLESDPSLQAGIETECKKWSSLFQ